LKRPAGYPIMSDIVEEKGFIDVSKVEEIQIYKTGAKFDFLVIRLLGKNRKKLGGFNGARRQGT